MKNRGFRFLSSLGLCCMLAGMGWLYAQPPLAGDLNGDKVVDLFDLQILTQQWMQFPEGGVPGDLNTDDQVDALDFRILGGEWRLDQNIPSILINEFVADNANGSGMEDPQGQAEDWIELYNYGGTDIDLAGMFITDDPTEPQKYQFPTGASAETTIPAGGYLVLWADNDLADGPLHLAFKLSAGGEQILLYKSDGYTLVDSVVYGAQKENLSLGRDPDSLAVPKAWAFLTAPTPGAANDPAYAGLVENLSCSLERGFYSSLQEAVLYTPTPGAEIYYTLDGSSPVENGSPGPTAALYSSPIQVSSTTTLRAVGLLDEHRPSSVLTRSFIFLADIRTQSDATAAARSFPATWETINYANTDGYPDYEMDPDVLTGVSAADFEDAMTSIPTVSLVTDIDHFFDPDTGIYTNLYGYHDSNDPGSNWERPVSLEIFDPTSGEKIQVDCAIRLVGNASRHPTNSKHSLRLSFKDSYGPSKLNFPLFPDSEVDTFDTIALRSQYHLSWVQGRLNAQYTRDTYVHETKRAMGHLAPHVRFVHLYINGLYWGLYQAAERPDNEFMASYEGGDPDDYEVIEGVVEDPPLFEWKGLGDETWTILWDLVNLFSVDNPADAAAYQQIDALLDLDQFIDHIILNTWLTNYDWGPKNWYASSRRPALPGEAPLRKWHFYPWDSEVTMQGLEFLAIPFTGTYVGGPHIIHNGLHQNAEYRMRFADRLQLHCLEEGGALTLPVALDRYNSLVNTIYGPVLAESARWGDFVKDHDNVRDYLIDPDGEEGPIEPNLNLFPGNVVPLFTRDVEFDAEWDFFQNTYFNSKVNAAIGHYQAAGLFPQTSAPEIQLNGQPTSGGNVSAGHQITLSGDENPVYYTLDGSEVITYIPPVSTGPDLELFSPSDSRKYLVPVSDIGTGWTGGEAFDDTAWLTANGGIGYDRADDYTTLIAADVEADMFGIQTSAYIRVPFSLDQTALDNIQFLKLRIQYDSGFIAYVNGVKAVSVNAPASPAWNAVATADHQDSEALLMKEFDLGAAAVGALKLGDNQLALHALNANAFSSDFLMRFELVGKQGTEGSWVLSASALEYTAPIELDQTTVLRARSLENGEWSALTSRKFTFGNPQAGLRVTELMYNPEITDTEYIELQNTGSSALDLTGIVFDQGISYTFGSQMLAPGERILLVENQLVFEATYGGGLPVAGEYTGALSNGGERITLLDSAGNVIQSFSYRDGWYDHTDGDGYSLTLRAPFPADPAAWSEEDSWKLSARWGGSPGVADPADMPLPGAVVINEVLAHSDLAPNDWIELHNTSGSTVDLSGWFLSDDPDARTKYRIADGTLLPAGGFLVFTQDNHFGLISADPGKQQAFALSENGDRVFLSGKLDGAGYHQGYFDQEDFGASDQEVSLGRYLKASTGTFNFVALTAKTPGSANAAPVVGPVVISEIHYHPDWPSGNTYSNEDYEYIRLSNISGNPVTLYDASVSEPWKIHGGVDFVFPAGTPQVLAAGESIYVVKNPAAFQSRYGVVTEEVLGPFTGNLSNDGDAVNLSKPGDVDALSVRQFIRVDRVNYSDGDHPDDGSDLWPGAADGEGKSLHKSNAATYGNDPASWTADNPSP